MVVEQNKLIDENVNAIKDALETISNLESLIESNSKSPSRKQREEEEMEYSEVRDYENVTDSLNIEKSYGGLTEAERLKNDLEGQIKNLKESLQVKDEIIIDYDKYVHEVTEQEKHRSSIAKSVVESAYQDFSKYESFVRSIADQQ